MFGVAKDDMHGQGWNYNKCGYFFHSSNKEVQGLRIDKLALKNWEALPKDLKDYNQMIE